VNKVAPVASNRLLSYIKTFFNWCVEEEKIDHSPAVSVKPLAKEIKRDRVLNDDEIRAVWKACEELGTCGRAVKFLLVTGQRRNEVSGMTWAEIDRAKRLWTLSKERTKAARAHEIPLSDLALSILDDCPELNQYVFASTRLAAAPISGWSKGKAALNKLTPQINDWHLHDLRHTCATGLAKLGTDRIVISKLLNHAEGGVTARYDQYTRDAEKRAAMDRWGAKLVEGKAAYRGGVQRLHFSTEGVIRRDRD
jgi:integrase